MGSGSTYENIQSEKILRATTAVVLGVWKGSFIFLSWVMWCVKHKLSTGKLGLGLFLGQGCPVADHQQVVGHCHTIGARKSTLLLVKRGRPFSTGPA